MAAETSLNTHKPLRLTNFVTRTQFVDTLHASSSQGICDGAHPKQVCLASLMSPGMPSVNQGDPSNQGVRSTQQLFEEAEDFYQQYFASVRRLNTSLHQNRWTTVKQEILEKGTYTMTEIELSFGAKLAWRNAPRCIGRIQWAKLQVFDCRHVTTPQEMFEAICTHIKYATNRGNIRSAITIFPTKTTHGEFRIWNAQFFSYAGYKLPDGSVVGDPMNLQFTDICKRLGWTGTGSDFDLLPLVLQVPGQEPQWFHIPPDLALQIPLIHPKYEWFASLRLQWYALPAVCNMKLDCGGLEFTAAPFSGWYMVTEIGTRDLADPHRYNILPVIATQMGLDTTSNNSLWRDKAVVELNLAVLHSFQKACVTIVDHYSAAESFLKHMENEVRLRGGCPADWIWIVPPTSGSLTPVFHHEMANYCLKPSFDYQEPAWRYHVWDNNVSLKSLPQNKHRLKFKEVAKAVKFTSNLFGKALARRIKATILFATETGKSEKFAHLLAQVFQHAFKAQVSCMDEYDIINLEHETLLLIVTSTFGNGDPPENGQAFAQDLFVLTTHSTNTGYPNKPKQPNSKTSRSFIKMNSQSDSPGYNSTSGGSRLPSTSSITSDMGSDLGPLSNLHFAVFALGSSAYPNYCAFGKYVDHLLGESGGERLLRLTTGDELNGQEQAFKTWAQQVFHMACETFCLADVISMEAAQAALLPNTLERDHIRFITKTHAEILTEGLIRLHNKKVKTCHVIFNENITTEAHEHSTRQIRLSYGKILDEGTSFQPGDHVGVFAVNNHTMVTQIIGKLHHCPDPLAIVQLQILTATKASTGVAKKIWMNVDRLPVCTLYDLLANYLDITTPPSQALLSLLATYATDLTDQERLLQLSTDATEYETWKQYNWPDLLQTMNLFPSIQVDAALLVSQIPTLQPRFYSLSSFASPTEPEYQFDLTYSVVTYTTPSGATRRGICTRYLADLKPSSAVQCFFRSSPNFHLPDDDSKPIIMVGAGTGIAPFRSFWQHREQLKKNKLPSILGTMVLFSGCRTEGLDLYSKEKSIMVKAGVLDYTFLALSRQPNVPKTYVQDKLLEASSLVYRLLSEQGGHFYVCGDCSMAEGVAAALRCLLKTAGKLSDERVAEFMSMLQDENRYHEDIFGITPRFPGKRLENPLLKSEKVVQSNRHESFDNTFL